MTTSTSPALSMSISQRLKQTTAAEHDRMELLMAQAKVFESKQNYAQFTLSQYYFQQDIEHLYAEPTVMELIPDLDIRGRAQAALLDLQDLGLIPQNDEIATTQVDFPQALGWIYVSEGSTLGAAFLYKEAQAKLGLDENNGARNLAAYPEGRMRAWKRFKQTLDDAQFSEQQQQAILAGALAGFKRFGDLLDNLNTLK